MASLRGLAMYAQQNGLMGHALKVNVGGIERCMVAEMANNVLAHGMVPQLRFVCDGYCGIIAHRPSKKCRTIDRQLVGSSPVAAPPGFLGDTGTVVGGGGGGRSNVVPFRRAQGY